MTKIKVLNTKGMPGHEAAGEMAENIKAEVYRYANRVPLALAVGVLEIVKQELMQEASGG